MSAIFRLVKSPILNKTNKGIKYKNPKLKIFKKIFKIHSPSKEWVNIRKEYLEYDTKCDLCDRKSECEEYLIDCTCSADTRRHVINGICGHFCPKDIHLVLFLVMVSL